MSDKTECYYLHRFAVDETPSNLLLQTQIMLLQTPVEISVHALK